MNSIVSIWLIAILLFLSGCKEEVVRPPKDLIPEDTFIKIIVELDLIEAVKSLHSSKEQQVETQPQIFYNRLWADYGVTESQFLGSFEYYRSDLDKMANIYESAAEFLKRKEDEINNQKQKKEVDRRNASQ